MTLTLAHFSDVHLSPLPPHAIFGGFRLKRLIGGLNWKIKRHRWQQRKVLDALVADIQAHAPDHVAMTGDLVNLSAAREFEAAREWLHSVGKPEWISFVPGNHDAYVFMPWKAGLSHFADYMTGSMAVDQPLVSAYNEQPFPYVRFKGNLAIVGLTTAVPQSLWGAGGELGSLQLQRLAELLDDLRRKGCFRCVLIHHPPMPDLAPPRKAMRDTKEFCAVMQHMGAELVLHGHNHKNSLNWIDSATGKVPVVGVSSASMLPGGSHEAASWNLFEIRRQNGRWITKMTRRTYKLSPSGFANEAEYTLSP